MEEMQIGHRGHTILIEQDDTPYEHPRIGWDNESKIAYKHEYQIGEEKISDPIDWLAEKVDFSEDDLFALSKGMGIEMYSNEMLVKLEEEFFKQYVALPIYLYAHSRVCIKTTPFSCTFDSGKAGYIYFPKEYIKENYGWVEAAKLCDRDVYDSLRKDVEVVNDYLEGNICRFSIYRYGEFLEGVGGYCGNPEDSGCIDDAKSIVDTLLRIQN